MPHGGAATVGLGINDLATLASVRLSAMLVRIGGALSDGSVVLAGSVMPHTPGCSTDR